MHGVWVGHAREGRRRLDNSALRCLCAGRILATSPSLWPPIARGLKYRRGQPTHKRFRARVVVRFGGSTPRCLSARRALGPMTGGTRNAYSETSNVSTLSTRLPLICLNDDGPTRRCPTVRGYPPTHAGGGHDAYDTWRRSIPRARARVRAHTRRVVTMRHMCHMRHDLAFLS